MKKINLILALLLCSSLAVYSQGLGQSLFLQNQGKSKVTDNKSSNKNNSEKNKNYTNGYNRINPINIKDREQRYSDDSAFYQNFVKRNGWFEGRGPKLTREERSHLNCYYKFSKKNAAGHWTLMQAFDGFGRLTTQHNYEAYILNQFDDNDSGANKEWKEKMKSMCQIELIGSIDGKDVIQERSLDAAGNVVFSAIPTKTGSNKYLYSYIDAWGRPAYVRTDSLGNDVGYANFVEVTRDERGYEILYKYTDRNGIPQKNIDGAFMNRRDYDDNGNQIRNMSLNVLGNRMTDDFGNCGMEYTYDYRGNMITAMSHDSDWKPMQHPDNGRSSLDDNTCGYWFKYDKYGREIERGYLDTLGNRCVNQYGVYSIIREYNNHGLAVHSTAYDINGNKISMNKFGIAEYVNTTNDNGYYLSAMSLNNKGELVNDESGVCKRTWAFEGDKEIEETEYQIIKDSVKVKFHFEQDEDGNELRIWANDDLIRVDSVNNRGHEILTAYYDLHCNPKESWGYHKRTSLYEYSNKKMTRIREWYDSDGEYADEKFSNGKTNGYSKEILISDTLNHKETKYQYFYGTLLKQAFVQENTEDMNSILAQYDITYSGEHARVGWWDNLHYHAAIEMDYDGNIKSFIGTNEFGEPSYMTSIIDDDIYHYYYKNGGSYFNYDEFGNIIPNDSMAYFRETLPKVFCIEVTDTLKAYQLGIKNGDIIVSYGDWLSSADLNEGVNYFYLETILQAPRTKKITLLRHNVINKESQIVVRNLPIGRISDFGIYPHLLYYTQKEKRRFVETCTKYNIKLGHNNTLAGDSIILLAVQAKGGFESTRLYYLPQYDVKDVGIVLYANEAYNKGIDTWAMNEALEKWDKQNMFYMSGSNLYITHDLTSIRHINKMSYGKAGMRFVPLAVNNDIYNHALECFKLLNDSIISKAQNNKVSNRSISLKKKQLVGIWEMKDYEDNVAYTFVMNIMKNGTANISINAIMEGEIQSGVGLKIAFSIKFNTAKWNLQENSLSFDFESEKSECIITDLDITGVDENEKAGKMEELKGMLEQNKEQLISDLRPVNLFNGHELIISDFTSKEFHVDGTDQPFKRIK